mmetsp:Transcript_67764/g.123536  ORF Transcript_67764/g.123536 Transcript_67764/m.123536 type:complete len:87 (-) Transcript_67764:33-293(-)
MGSASAVQAQPQAGPVSMERRGSKGSVSSIDLQGRRRSRNRVEARVANFKKTQQLNYDLLDELEETTQGSRSSSKGSTASPAPESK